MVVPTGAVVADWLLGARSLVGIQRDPRPVNAAKVPGRRAPNGAPLAAPGRGAYSRRKVKRKEGAMAREFREASSVLWVPE